MRLTLLIILLSFTCKAQMFYSPRDKNLHYGAGLLIGIICGEIAYQITDDYLITIASSFIPPLVVGGLKESYDGTHGGTKSLEDFVVTGIGGATATLGMTIRININREKQYQHYIKHEFKPQRNTLDTLNAAR